MKHDSGNTVTKSRVKDLFSEALQDGLGESVRVALDALRHWRPRGIRAYLQGEGRIIPSREGLRALIGDTMAFVTEKIEQDLSAGEFATGEEVIQAVSQLLFDGGLVLEFLDSGDYAEVPSRDQVISYFDEALDLDDQVRFNKAVGQLLRYAVRAIKSSCRHDEMAAQEVAWHIIRPVVISQFNEIWQDLGEGYERREATLPRTGEKLVDVVMARLCGFRKDGRRIPGAVQKYWSSQDVYLSLDVPRAGDEDGDGTTWADTLVDHHAEHPREQGQLVSLIEGLERKEMLDGELRKLEEWAHALPGHRQRETAQAIVDLCRKESEDGDYQGVTVYRFRVEGGVIAPKAMAKLKELLGQKQEKRVRDRVVWIRWLLESVGLARPYATPDELRSKIAQLLSRAEEAWAGDEQGKKNQDNKHNLETARAIGTYLQNELDLLPVDCSEEVEIPFMQESGSWVLDDHLSRFLQEKCGIGSDAARKRMSRLASSLRDSGLLRKVES